MTYRYTFCNVTPDYLCAALVLVDCVDCYTGERDEQVNLVVDLNDDLLIKVL